jgi:hypothetical protein
MEAKVRAKDAMIKKLELKSGQLKAARAKLARRVAQQVQDPCSHKFIIPGLWQHG